MLVASPEYFSVCTHNSLSVTVECDMSAAANGTLFRQTVQRRVPSDECHLTLNLWSVRASRQAGQSWGLKAADHLKTARLQIQRSRVRFPALPDFLSISGYGTGSTQPREFN